MAAVFCVKLVVMLQLKDHPLLQPEGSPDSLTYVQLAQRVLAGDVALGPGLYFVSPLYIYFVAATLGISGSLTFVRIVQIALGTCAVWFVFQTARSWFGTRAAWAAGVLAALTGVFTFYEIVILQSALDTVLTAAALYGLTRALDGAEGPGVSAAAAAGILFGLQVLNRPNVIVAVTAVVVTLLAIRRFRVAVVLTAGVGLALVPVVLRNAVVSHQFAVSSSQGGLNLYIGNNASATGQYNAVPGVRANIEGQSDDTRHVAEQAVGRRLSDAEVSSYFTGLATTWMRAHPADAAQLFGRKLALVFNRRHQWLDFSYPYYAHDADSILWLLAVGPWLLIPLGFAGCAAIVSNRPGPRRYAEFAAWAAFIPFYALSVALFFVAERYRLPLLVPLCVTAGAALDLMLRTAGVLRGPDAHDTFDVRSIRAPAALFIAGVVVTSWPFHLDDGRYSERLRLAKVLMNEKDFSRAAIELEEAHRIDPANSVAEFNLGIALMNDGRGQEGVTHIRHAVDAGVPVAGARYALAGALLAVDRDEAARLLRTYSPTAEDTPESCLQVAMLALNARVPDVAERYLQRAVLLRPGWRDAEQLLREVRSQREKSDGS